MRDWRHGDGVFLWAFDLIELNGDDLRRDPLAVRKTTLTSLSALRSTSISTTTTARSSSSRPAGLGLRASSPSGAIRRIGQAARGIGSRARTRTRRL
jgi:hypothetical protein